VNPISKTKRTLTDARSKREEQDYFLIILNLSVMAIMISNPAILQILQAVNYYAITNSTRNLTYINISLKFNNFSKILVKYLVLVKHISRSIIVGY